MIENPNEYIPDFADAGADWVSVHYEACPHLHRSLELIAHHGMKPGVVLNPATRVDLIVDILPMVHHVLIMSVNPGFGGQNLFPFRSTRSGGWLNCARNWGWHLESKWTAAWLTIRWPRIVQAGAELLVAGNAVFGGGHPERDARALLAAARAAAAGE
jgi:ribulose-phosphate 3-epimerase